MKSQDIDREVVVILSERETVVGVISEVNEEHGTFRVVTRHGKEYQFAVAKVNVKFRDGDSDGSKN